MNNSSIAETDVVVGVDDSDNSQDAVRWAAREAQLRGTALTLVNVNTWQQLSSEMWPLSVAIPEGELRDYGDVVLDEAAQKAEATAPDVVIKRVVTIGGAAAELVKHIGLGALGVVGRRGLVGKLSVGGVTSQVARHSRRVVTVVPAGSRIQGDSVVVGVDGSDHSLLALSHAFEEASLRQLPVRVVHSSYDFLREPDKLRVTGNLSPEQIAAEQERALATLTSTFTEKYPTVPVEHHAVAKRPAQALFELAESAALLVVGSRGRGGLAGLLLGSVSESVIRHSKCPTLVVR